MSGGRILHSIPPVFDSESRVLILGSFPSVKSREEGFFYGHPQNRFWRVLGAVFEEDPPVTVAQKIAFLHAHHIALWDVIASCEITGSSDASIKNAVPNDLTKILDYAPIQKICVNGKTAEKYYVRYAERTVCRTAHYLPSTSPANAAWSLEDLREAWREIQN